MFCEILRDSGELRVIEKWGAYNLCIIGEILVFSEPLPHVICIILNLDTTSTIFFQVSIARTRINIQITEVSDSHLKDIFLENQMQFIQLQKRQGEKQRPNLMKSDILFEPYFIHGCTKHCST